MARTKLIITSFNTDKYHDLITLFSPPPRSLEVNMSQSHEEGKNSSTESFTKRSFRPEPEHLATHSSDSNTSNKHSAVPNDQQQGFASVEFVEKAVDNQNDRFLRLEHAIKNLISGLHQARPTSGRRRTRGSTEIQDGDTSLTPTVSARPEDTCSSFPHGSLGPLPKKRKLSDKPGEKIPRKVNLSPLPSDDPLFDYQSPMYVSEDYSDSSDSDEGHHKEFPPPTENPDVSKGDTPDHQPDRPTNLDSAPNGRPFQIMYNPDLVCDDSIFHIDEDIAQYFSKYRFKVLTNDQFRKIKETFSKPKIEFLGPPSVNEVIMASKSVRNNTGLLKGDSSLSKIQERLTYSTFPLLDLMQKIRSDVQLTKEEILTSLEQSIVLSSSSFASLSSVRRQRFRNVLALEYASLVNYDSETPSKFLFGDNIADEVEKRSKEQRIIKKISRNSFQQSSRPAPNNQFRTFRSGSNTFNQSTYKHQVHPKRRAVFRRNQHSGFKNKNSNQRSDP